MTDFTAIGQIRWLPCRNDSGEEIPPFGIIREDGAAVVENGMVVIIAKKSNVYGSQYSHYINGPTAIPAGGYGRCTGDFPSLAAYSTADGTPAAGELWGPRDAQWILRKNTGGFRVVKVVDSTNGYMLVTRSPMLSFFGKTTATVSAGSTNQVAVWAGTAGSESFASAYVDDVFFRSERGNGDAVYCSWNPGSKDEWHGFCAEEA